MAMCEWTLIPITLEDNLGAGFEGAWNDSSDIWETTGWWKFDLKVAQLSKVIILVCSWCWCCCWSWSWFSVIKLSSSTPSTLISSLHERPMLEFMIWSGPKLLTLVETSNGFQSRFDDQSNIGGNKSSDTGDSWRISVGNGNGFSSSLFKHPVWGK